jgi:Gas vesicle synthesis protein GvpL/GvpF
VADELSRWAGERAPEVLARAEAEAVAALREALVEAAIARRSRAEPAPERLSKNRGAERPSSTPAESRRASKGGSARGEREARSGDALWAYCVLPAGDLLPGDVEGVAPPAPIERIDGAELGVLVSRVPLAEFAAEPLRENLNDLVWLERVARAHEEVLDRALRVSPIVPLRLCTIYEDEDSVRAMLAREQPSLSEALAALAGRQEWGVKVLVDPERLAVQARARSPEGMALEEEGIRSSPGGTYMRRRRAERETREASAALAREIAERVHARLQDWAIDAVTRPSQNRDLSGHEGEMLLNGAYLVETERVDGLAELVAELEERYSSLGARIELTGPWPPYNFVPGGDTTAVG